MNPVGRPGTVITDQCEAPTPNPDPVKLVQDLAARKEWLELCMGEMIDSMQYAMQHNRIVFRDDAEEQRIARLLQRWRSMLKQPSPDTK